jgi:hypothetical protein
MSTTSKEANRARHAGVPRLALTRAELAASVSISTATLDGMDQRGEGPCAFFVGQKDKEQRVGIEAAREWIEEREKKAMRKVLVDPDASAERKAWAETMLQRRARTEVRHEAE